MLKIRRVLRKPAVLTSSWPTATRRTIRSVEAEVDGKPYEFTSFDGGPWEAYDHPSSYEGLPRFVGHLPAHTAEKLEAMARKFVSDRTVTTPEFYEVGEPMSRSPRRSRSRHSR